MDDADLITGGKHLNHFHDSVARTDAGPWSGRRHESAESFYIAGRGKGCCPFPRAPIPKTKPGRLHRRVDTPLVEGIALANPLRWGLDRHGAVKPQRMLIRAVKPTRRPQTANAQPATFLVGLTYRTAVCGPACTVVWQGRRGDPSPMPITPCMFDSLGVKVLSQPDGGEG